MIPVTGISVRVMLAKADLWSVKPDLSGSSNRIESPPLERPVYIYIYRA